MILIFRHLCSSKSSGFDPVQILDLLVDLIISKTLNFMIYGWWLLIADQ